MVAAALSLMLVASAATALAAGPAQATTPWPGGRWQPATPRYGMVVVKDVPLKMSDGATLYGDIGYPSDRTTGKRAAGTFPVLLSQNPYPGGEPDDYFVKRGYIYAVVDVRGTGRTDAPPGQTLHFDLFNARQTKDGVELVNWAAHRLSGSNGVVGLTGCSYLGINQLFTAAAVGPRSPIAAILPACASNGYEIYFSGGIPTSIAGLFGSAGSIVGTKWLKQSQAWGAQLSNDIKAGGPAAYNRAFWLSRSTAPIIPDIVRNGIPALLWSGWRATELTGVLDEYAIFQNAYAGRAPFVAMPGDSSVTGRYQVVVGSGEHGTGIDPAIELEWFDRWLKHDRNGIEETSTPMHLFEEKGDALGQRRRLPAGVGVYAVLPRLRSDVRADEGASGAGHDRLGPDVDERHGPDADIEAVSQGDNARGADQRVGIGQFQQYEHGVGRDARATSRPAVR